MTKAGITRQPFGILPNGETADLYTLVNARGAQAQITNYGGILVSLRVPDSRGALDDIVLGYDDLDGYLANKPYFGATVGRYANRIANARFALGGVEYQLAANDGRTSSARRCARLRQRRSGAQRGRSVCTAQCSSCATRAATPRKAIRGRSRSRSTTR
jgi:hypothetical protein